MTLSRKAIEAADHWGSYRHHDPRFGDLAALLRRLAAALEPTPDHEAQAREIACRTFGGKLACGPHHYAYCDTLTTAIAAALARVEARTREAMLSDEAVERGAQAIYCQYSWETVAWEQRTDEYKWVFREQARAALRAASEVSK